jgi:hypothetical protein
MKNKEEDTTRKKMNAIIFFIFKCVAAVAAAGSVWFGAGPWLMNQPSSLLYFAGVAANIGVIYPLANIILGAINRGKKEFE